MLPGRTEIAINSTRRDRGLDTTAPRKSVLWSDDELNAIRLNPTMANKELMKLPWLKNKTYAQISVKKHYLKTHENK
jgi:hypothetical protein